MKFIGALIALMLLLNAYEIRQTRHTVSDFLIVHNLAINNRLDTHQRALNGFNDRLHAQANYEDEIQDQLSKLQGRTPQQFRRRKHL